MGIQALLSIGAFLITTVVLSAELPVIDKSCDCGNSNEGVVGDRIVGGIISIPHAFPWTAAIFRNGKLFCGAVLINDRYILTAGHCVYKANASDIEVGLGMHNIQKPEEGLMLKVEKIKAHENYVRLDWYDTDDIALIKLANKVEFTDNIQPICLPKEGSEYAGVTAKVTGWGRVKSGGNTSQYLQQADLKVLSHSSCKKTNLGKHILDSNLCAYAEDTDACQGDSGGPLIYQRPNNDKYETIGVVSWGIGCAQRGYPGVYVKNVDYLSWIYSNTVDATYCMDKE